jgi:hypothetical protein
MSWRWFARFAQSPVNLTAPQLSWIAPPSSLSFRLEGEMTMTNHPKIDALPLPLDPDRYHFRFFLHQPEGGWVSFPESRAMAIYRGELPIRSYAGATMKMAVAVVEHGECNPATLKSVYISDWKIGDDGFVDNAEQMRGFVEKLDGGVDRGEVATTEEVEAINRCLDDLPTS